MTRQPPTSDFQLVFGLYSRFVPVSKIHVGAEGAAGDFPLCAVVMSLEYLFWTVLQSVALTLLQTASNYFFNVPCLGYSDISS